MYRMKLIIKTQKSLINQQNKPFATFYQQSIDTNWQPFTFIIFHFHTIRAPEMFSKLQFFEAVKNPLQKIKASLKQAISKQEVQVTEIVPNKLYHISPPSPQSIDSLLQVLKGAHQFQIWNFSEYSYDEVILTKLLDGRERNSDGKQIVYNLTYEYFANIPFCQMIKSIEHIETFLSLDENNRVYVHCQDNKRRSAVFLASYIFLTGLETDIVASILKVNQLLNISIEDKPQHQGSVSGAIYKSQHLVLKNLMNYINNSSFINCHPWSLIKILINNAPKIHHVLKPQILSQHSAQIKFKVLLEIRAAEGVVYKKIFQDQFIEGKSLCLRIPENEPLLLKDDFLIIVKYVHQKKGYSILRAQLNTNFIYDPFFRVQRNDMDLSVNNAHPQNQTVFMDLLLKSNPKETSELSKLNILKQNLPNQKIPETYKKQTSKQSVETLKAKDIKKQSEEEDDGFGILDEQEQAEHNQKMQRQIQEELARQLENIRKKKNQEGKKSDQKDKKEEVEAKDLSMKTSNETEKSQSEGEKQKQNLIQLDVPAEERKKTEGQKDQESASQSKEPAAKVSQKQAQQKEAEGENEEQAEEQQNSSEASSSSQEESSSEEGAQEEEDLDDYLTKLESQAEKNE